MGVDELKHAIGKLDGHEFDALLSWVIGPEKRRRDAAPAAADSQVDLVRQQREQGLVAAPSGEQWEERVIYLPGETAEHQDRSWEVVCAVPTTEEPGTGDAWAEILSGQEWEEPEGDAPEPQ